MALADYQQLVDDLVRDPSGTVSPEARDRAIEEARLRYSADFPLVEVPAGSPPINCEQLISVDGEDTVPALHRLPVACYAAALLCRQLATYYSGQRETTLNADNSHTDVRARDYAARANEYRATYYLALGLSDPYARHGSGGAASGSGVAAAAAVKSWPGRQRSGLVGGA